MGMSSDSFLMEEKENKNKKEIPDINLLFGYKNKNTNVVEMDLPVKQENPSNDSNIKNDIKNPSNDSNIKSDIKNTSNDSNIKNDTNNNDINISTNDSMNNGIKNELIENNKDSKTEGDLKEKSKKSEENNKLESNTKDSLSNGNNKDDNKKENSHKNSKKENSLSINNKDNNNKDNSLSDNNKNNNKDNSLSINNKDNSLSINNKDNNNSIELNLEVDNEYLKELENNSIIFDEPIITPRIQKDLKTLSDDKLKLSLLKKEPKNLTKLKIPDQLKHNSNTKYETDGNTNSNKKSVKSENMNLIGTISDKQENKNSEIKNKQDKRKVSDLIKFFESFKEN